MRKNNDMCNLIQEYITLYTQNKMNYEQAKSYLSKLISAVERCNLPVQDEIKNSIASISLQLSTIDYYREELVDDLYNICENIDKKFCKITDYVRYWLQMSSIAQSMFSMSILNDNNYTFDNNRRRY